MKTYTKKEIIKDCMEAATEGVCPCVGKKDASRIKKHLNMLFNTAKRMPCVMLMYGNYPLRVTIHNRIDGSQRVDFDLGTGSCSWSREWKEENSHENN